MPYMGERSIAPGETLETFARVGERVAQRARHRLTWICQLWTEFLSVSELPDDETNRAISFPPAGWPHF
jgi:hypothetical protein